MLVQERERQRDRETERQRQRDRETERARDGQTAQAKGAVTRTQARVLNIRTHTMLAINSSVRYNYILWFYLAGVVATAVLYIVGHVIGLAEIQGYWMVVSVQLCPQKSVHALSVSVCVFGFALCGSLCVAAPTLHERD